MLLLPLILQAALLLLMCSPLLISGFDTKSTNQENKDNLMNTDGFIDDITDIKASESILTPAKDCPKCECGRTNPLSRIVGGHETKINEYPWMTMLLENDFFFCGGSLITDRHILTAAHCAKKSRNLIIKLMKHDLSKDGKTQTITRKVTKVLGHEKYDELLIENDIAILYLDQPVNLTGQLRPVCMPDPGKDYSGYDGIIIGWGDISEGGSSPSKLQEAVVPILSNEECRKSDIEKIITDNMLCAGYPEGGTDSCQGDSGGPLVVANSTSKIYQIAGIVSWGIGCARPGYPGVYTRVNRYLDWIRKNSADGCYCDVL